MAKERKTNSSEDLATPAQQAGTDAELKAGKGPEPETRKDAELETRNAGAREAGPDLLDLDQAIALLKTTRPTFYRWLHSGRIRGIKVGRQWRFERSDIESFLKGEQPRIDAGTNLVPLLATLSDHLKQLGVSFQPAQTDPVRKAVDLMIALAIESRATDIHLDPLRQAEGGGHHACLRYRIDGALHERASFDLRGLPAVIEQWKRLAGCDAHERARPQDGRIRMAPPQAPQGEEVDMRVNIVPAHKGETLAVRLLDHTEGRQTLEELGLEPADLQKLRAHLAVSFGMVVVTGLSGTGKTTTLYAALRHLARPSLKVMSLEDPVEVALPGVVQIPINQEACLTFQAGLRSIFRADPDIVMVGEIRDPESLRMAQQLALTGHVVLTSLHTSDAPGALARMLHVGVDPFLAGDATRAVVAQRLVRRLCPECSVPGEPDPGLLAKAHEVAAAGGLKWQALPNNYREARGCPACAGTGSCGRTVLAEVLSMSPALREALMRGAGASELRAIAVKEGMTTIAAHGVLRAARGEVALAEALAGAPADLETAR